MEEGWSAKQVEKLQQTPARTPTAAGARNARTGHTPTTMREHDTRSSGRNTLLDEIEILYKEAIAPLRHPGMYKAIYWHSFKIESPGYLRTQPLDILEAGMALYRHLTAQLVTWDRKGTPDPEEWIAQQKQTLPHPTNSDAAPPDGVDPETGEDHRSAMPDEWMTKEERQEQQARDEALPSNRPMPSYRMASRR